MNSKTKKKTQAILADVYKKLSAILIQPEWQYQVDTRLAVLFGTSDSPPHVDTCMDMLLTRIPEIQTYLKNNLIGDVWSDLPDGIADRNDFMTCRAIGYTCNTEKRFMFIDLTVDWYVLQIWLRACKVDNEKLQRDTDRSKLYISMLLGQMAPNVFGTRNHLLFPTVSQIELWAVLSGKPLHTHTLPAHGAYYINANTLHAVGNPPESFAVSCAWDFCIANDHTDYGDGLLRACDHTVVNSRANLDNNS